MEKTERIGVIGAGAFGTALAHQLAGKGYEVILWAREKEVVEEIRSRHENSLFLPQIPLSPNFQATNDLREVSKQRDLVLFAVPSQFLRRVLEETAPFLSENSVFVNVAKGIEVSSLKLLSAIFEEVLPSSFHSRITYLSGPTFAREVALGHPAVVSLACRDQGTGVRVKEILQAPHLQIRLTNDVLGLELAGAVKNVIAIACGISDGLGYGETTRAMLITWGLEEMVRLGERLGGRQETFYGASGVGDLLLTCGGGLSRNKGFGMELAKGKTVTEITASRTSVAEGVPTAKAIHELCNQYKLSLPICDRVYKILYERGSPRILFE